MSQEILTTYCELKRLLNKSPEVYNISGIGAAHVMKKYIQDIVEEYHITLDGGKREISFRGNKKMWATKLPNGKTIYCATKEGLYEKIANHYAQYVEILGKEYSFEEVWKMAEEEYERKHTQKKTIQSHHSDYKRFISKDLAKTDIRKITTDSIEDYAFSLVKEKKLSSKSFTAFKGVVNLAFEYALRKQFTGVTRNPIKYIDNKAIYRLCKNDLYLREESDVMYTEEEVNLILAEAEKRAKMPQFHGYYIYQHMIMAHNELGCRPGELVALRWKDIFYDEFGKPTIHIHAQQVDNRDGTFSYVPYTKNEKGTEKNGRYFPVTTRLESIFQNLQQLQSEKGIKSEYIFVREDNEWIHAKDYLKMLKKICDKLGIASKGSYAFRRAVNSAFIESGISNKTSGKLIGNLGTTNLNHYTFAQKEYVKLGREALEKRNETRSTLVNPENGYKKSSKTLNFQAF